VAAHTDTFDEKEDLASACLRQVEAATSKRCASMARETGAWWRDFWSRGFVRLRSAEGQAQFIEQSLICPYTTCGRM
jgi:hypothetical protein